jgi:hypothetical protein
MRRTRSDLPRLARTMSACLLAFVTMCDRATTPTQPEAYSPLNVRAATDLADGTGGGNAHFFWLAPIADRTSFTGAFDDSQSPVVQICATTDHGCANPLVVFTTDGHGDDAVRVDRAAQQYLVNWHSGRYALDPAMTYRISVRVRGWELGHVDVRDASSGGQRRPASNGFITIAHGATLPIKFRVEVGALDGIALVGSDAPVIVSRTTTPALPVVVLAAGGTMAFQADPATGRITGAALTGSGHRATVTLDAQGRPALGVYDNVIALYSNWTATTVDIAVGFPDGSIQLRRAVPLSPATAGFAPSAVRVPSQGFAALDLTFNVGGYTVTQRDLETVSLAVSWATCGVAGLGSIANPVVVPGAFFSCGLAQQAWIAFRQGESAASTTAAVVDGITSGLGCAEGNPFECVSLATATGSAVWSAVNLFVSDDAALVQQLTFTAFPFIGSWHGTVAGIPAVSMNGTYDGNVLTFTVVTPNTHNTGTVTFVWVGTVTDGTFSGSLVGNLANRITLTLLGPSTFTGSSQVTSFGRTFTFSYLGTR